MKIYRDTEGVPTGIETVVTVGKFDGLHRGHRGIIDGLIELSEKHRLESMVITFDRHPLEILHPGAAPVALNTLDQKLELLAETGVQNTVVLTFDEQRKDQTAEDFIRMLAEDLGAKIILVGEDFHFGSHGSGDIDLLRSLAPEYGYLVEVIPDAFDDYDGSPRRVSSTWVRELLAQGRIAESNAFLGRRHRVTGEVVHGLKRGRELGFPTANLEANSRGFVPADGVYAGYLLHDGERYPAAISVGTNPTFDDVLVRQVEAFLPGVEIDLYGKEVTIEFVDRIRGMVAFDGIDELIERMHEDVREVLQRLHEE